MTTAPKAPRKPRVKAAPKEKTAHAIRFTFQEAFTNTDEDMIIELCCFTKGPRGGLGEEFQPTVTQWDGLLKKMAAKGMATS